MPNYLVRSAAGMGGIREKWDSIAWNQADILHLAHFRPEGSDHRPATSACLLYDDEGIAGMFRVEDRYVRSVHTRYQDPVCKDSCVEFFFLPVQGNGYFNFEFNCGGTLHCSYIIDPVRTPDGFRDYVMLPDDADKEVLVRSSLPKTVDPEMRGPVTWSLQFFIPFRLLEPYVGATEDVGGRSWRANFYKCGDETSHPHWASWAPLPEKNFHLPECFGSLSFAEKRTFL